MATLTLELQGLEGNGSAPAEYDLTELRQHKWEWDRVVKATHLTNCAYQEACSFNLFVKDGVVLREEQAANYPALNDPDAPDVNPRGCQKGVCYAQRMYDPTRLKYPMKRVGERGEGKWKRISWDEALTEVADTLIDTLVSEGPDRIVQGGGSHVPNTGSEGMAANAFFIALGGPLSNVTADNGDEHQGAAVTFGKVILDGSADNWFYADMVLIWGGNPAYTNIPNYHFIAEARYNGAKVVAICPDYSPSAVHADQWVPVEVGTDAALALALAQVILKQRLFKADFVREQTDLPLLVRADTGRFLREKDLKRGGREDAFYLYDQATGQVVEAPRKSLVLGDLVPALEGEYQVQTLHGPVRVRPVCELLRDHLNTRFTPTQAAQITGVPAPTIEQLAREIAAARGVVNITTANWGKFYHGDLIERAIILVFALCGHMGRKGASYNAFPALGLDTALAGVERHGRRMLLAAAGSDPRYAAWKEDGYTTEMILLEYTRQAVSSGAVALTSMVHYLHGGLLELSERAQSWDPHLKRPLGEYVAEALARGWQVVVPPADRAPRVLLQVGGNVFRRGRATDQFLAALLPKLQLIVSVDWRMCTTALYSDYVLPACGWYERTTVSLFDNPLAPFAHVNDRAVPPLYESLSEWTIYVRLARALSQRARERGILSFQGRDGKERRLDRLEDQVTAGGLYAEDDDEGPARDAFVNAGNVEPLSWEEFKERGIAAYTSIGTGPRSIGNACDLVPGEPVVPLTWHTDKKEPYPTLTRRIQFYLDHDWYLELEEHLPTHKEPPKAGGDYPLQVTGGHARWSVHSDWIDDALLLGLQRGEPTMFMSAEDAQARGIRDGDLV
ncbi:MAG: molybdopterin-dependent oxidoreductase, partial [Chloroflexi bacterium]|nr:molybdopterin-dependent oxidoreductase [Chloroflexota bacterium]